MNVARYRVTMEISWPSRTDLIARPVRLPMGRKPLVSTSLSLFGVGFACSRETSGINGINSPTKALQKVIRRVLQSGREL